VKRSSISEYERGKSTPDAITLKRLLAAMGFRWTALDFGGWFVDRLLIDCRTPEGEESQGGTAPLLVTASALATQLSGDVVAASQTAARLSKLVLVLQGEQRKEDPPSKTGNPGAAARDRKAERQAAQALWTRIKPLPRKEQMEALRGAPPEAQWAVCDLLCIESQRLCGEDPVKAASLCALALAAADLADGGEGVRAKLRGIAWAHFGNALRAQDDLDGAERAFISADENWKVGEGVADGLLEEGLIFALKASLRRDQRRFDEAKDLLERASLLASSLTFRTQVMVSKAWRSPFSTPAWGGLSK
jgi:transcriptional regulator with XRE-family HTH domain